MSLSDNRNRFIFLSGLLLCLLVGGYLRVRGADWGAGNPRARTGGYAHPDERSVYNKTGGLRWKEVPRDEGETWFSHKKRVFDANFIYEDNLTGERSLDWNGGLNLDSFNYGSFPYYVLFALSNLANGYTIEQARWFLAYVFLVLVVLFLLRWFLGPILRAREGGGGRRLSGVLMPVLGLVAVFSGLCIVAGYVFRGGENPRWVYDNWAILGRPLSGLAGVLTILYIYRIGARVYSRQVGLVAAILLTFTVLHIQLSHFFTFDVILAFFTTASVYSLLVFLDAESWWGRWRAVVAASIWAGLAMATKFGGILLFVPWAVAVLWSFWKNRPHVAFYRPRSIGAYLHFTLIGIISFALIWGVAFLAQPYGYLDEVGGKGATELSFVHIDLKKTPPKVRGFLVRLGERLDPYTSKVGFHFKSLKYPKGNREFEDLVAIGGGKYWKDVVEQRNMALKGGVPWTRQYTGTTPFVYQWKNLIYYSMGVPLGIVCLLGLAIGFGRPFYRPCLKEWIIWFWMIVNFVPTHMFHTKFPRYLAPELPFFCLWGAALLVWGYAYFRSRERKPDFRGFRWSHCVAAGAAVTVIWSGFYSFAFLDIYTGKHTWTAAGEWFEKEVPAGKKLLSETWDDEVPWDSGIGGRYRREKTDTINSGEERHIRKICQEIAQADYYCFSSKRNYGAFLQAEGNSDGRVCFYKSLFAGNLGFQLVKTFSKTVNVLGVPLRHELADESFSLYDHPTVHVFKKIERLTADQLADRILGAPQWVLDLTMEQVLTADEHRSILAPRALYALHLWVLAVLVLGWVFWPISFSLFRASPDGGLFASKTLGLLLLTYVSWFGSSVGWWTNARWATTLVLLLWFAVSYSAVRRTGAQMAGFLKGRWRLVVFSEVLFLLVFAYFMSIKMSNPDVYWGEKPMDASFVNAAYKTERFPAVDPWFAGTAINYYSYGHTVVGLFGKWVGVPPEYAYNLAVGTWPAMVFILVFGIVFNLTESKLGGVVAGFLATMAGNGKSFFQFAANLKADNGLLEPKMFRERYTPHDGLTGYLGDAWEQISLGLSQTCAVFVNAFSVSFPGVFQKLKDWFPTATAEAFAAASPEAMPRLVGFDSYFWKLSRICKSTVACEFPMWSVAFADLHAHLLVMPFGMLLLSLIVAYCQRKRLLWQLRADGDIQATRREVGGIGTTFAQIAAIGFVLGVVHVTNTWDVPGLVGLLFAGCVLLFVYSGRNWAVSSRWGLGRGIVRMGLWGHRLRKTAWIKIGVFQEILLPVVTVLLLSRAFLYPFHQVFQVPERVKGIGWMHEAACGWTTPYEFVQIFGFFLPIVLLGLWVLYWRWISTTRWAWLKGLVALVAALGVSFYFTIWMRDVAGLAYTRPEASERIPTGDGLPFWRYLDADIAYVVGGFCLAILLLFLPFLLRRGISFRDRLGALILGLGLAILVGVEVVYIQESWGPPSHRWNTQFKFHLQAWLCLSVGCGWLLGIWWKRPSGLAPLVGRFLARTGRYICGYPILILSLALAALFPLVAPFLFSQAEGFRGRTRQIEGAVTVDGLHFMRVQDPDVAATIDWLRSGIQGTPVTLEAAGLEYHHDRSRFSTHTGLPTLIGWPHHSGERGNHPGPRIEECQTIYTSTNRERVRDLLRKREVRYVIVGPTERKLYSTGDGRGLKKFEEWRDLFQVAFRSEIESPGVTVYAVHSNYELQEDWKELPPEQEPEHFIKDQGVGLLFGREGFEPGQYKEPRGIAAGPTGQIAVADTFNHRIQAYDGTGKFLWWMGEQGEEPGFFKEPSDVAFDENGDLYVLDSWNSRVQVFSATGQVKNLIPGLGGGARGIVVGTVPLAEQSGDDWKIPKNARSSRPAILVANTSARNVLVLDPGGKAIGQWGRGSAEEGGLGEPVDVEITPLGLAVADAKNVRVAFFDGRGRFLDSWPIPTPSTGDLTNEIHLAWDDKNRRLVVTDPDHDRLFVFSETGEVLKEIPLEGKPTGVAMATDGRIYVTARTKHRVVLVPNVPGAVDSNR